MRAKRILRKFLKENDSAYFSYSELERYMEREYKDPMPVLCDRILCLKYVKEIGRRENNPVSVVWYEARLPKVHWNTIGILAAIACIYIACLLGYLWSRGYWS